MKVSDMNMPGFTATYTLYPPGESHWMRPSTGDAAPPGVFPQLARQLDLLLCLEGCSLAGSDPACTETCYRMEHIRSSDDHNKGGSGGRPPGPGDFVCGPCFGGKQRCGVPGLGFKLVPCIN